MSYHEKIEVFILKTHMKTKLKELIEDTVNKLNRLAKYSMAVNKLIERKKKELIPLPVVEPILN